MTNATAEQKARHQQIAETILEQLGGNKFRAMTGARNCAFSGPALEFALPARFAKNGINFVRIELTARDDYTMSFWKLSRSARTEPKKIAEVDMLYYDMLQDVFTMHTGLDTRL